MAGTHFDDLLRTLTNSRRSLVSGSLAAATGWLGVSAGDAKKKRRRNKHKKRKPRKSQPNEFGCLGVGQPCQGDSALCCSGICEGTKPKKGKKDTSRCVAHDTSICRADFDLCSTGDAHVCNADNLRCACLLTTGNAGFCGEVGDGGAADHCRVCTHDMDCQAEFGAGAACVVFTGICDQYCNETGGTACLPPCSDTIS